MAPLERPAGSPLPGGQGVRFGAVLALALAAGIGVWLGTRDTGSGTSAQPPPAKQVVPITTQGLATLASALHAPIYWAGPAPGVTYELTRLEDGRVYIRYLRRGMKVGDKRVALTIGTYPVAGAFAAVQRSAAQPGSARINANNGAVAFFSRKRPTNVYLAFPGVAYQVEVFDPNPAQGRRLVESGKIAPVRPPSAQSGATLVSSGQLALAARSAGHPVYWAGPQTGAVYELTKTKDGRFYVRYLPPGTKAGANIGALTVGTYVSRNAFPVTTGLASKSGSVQVPVTGGGIAFYARSAPSSVYVAFPGSDVQIEVFDPSPTAARQLVTSGKIVPIS